jgi:hypothetical protein
MGDICGVSGTTSSCQCGFAGLRVGKGQGMGCKLVEDGSSRATGDISGVSGTISDMQPRLSMSIFPANFFVTFAMITSLWSWNPPKMFWIVLDFAFWREACYSPF